MADQPQKKAKGPGKKAKGLRSRKAMQSEFHSDVEVQKFLEGKFPARYGMKLARVEAVHGGSRFDLIAEDGSFFKSATLKKTVKLESGKQRAEGAKTFIKRNDFVLTDGDTIYGKFSDEDARAYLGGRYASMKKNGSAGSRGTRRSGSGSSRSSSGSRGTRRSGSSRSGAAAAAPPPNFGNAPEGFAWNLGNYKGKKALARLASRKAGHAKEAAEQKAIRAAAGAAFVPNLFRENAGAGRIVLVEARPPPREGPGHVERFGFRSSAANRNQAVANFFRARMEGAAPGNNE
jgi:hypothetical protein